LPSTSIGRTPEQPSVQRRIEPAVKLARQAGVLPRHVPDCPAARFGVGLIVEQRDRRQFRLTKLDLVPSILRYRDRRRFAASNAAARTEIADIMFTLRISLIGAVALCFSAAPLETAAAACTPNGFNGQSSGSCESGANPSPGNQTGTSYAPCGASAPPLSGVYEPSTGTGNGGVYEPSTGTGNGGVYSSTTGALPPSGSLGGGVGTLGCPIGGSVGALHNLPVDPSGRVLERGNRSIDAQTPANKRTTASRIRNSTPGANSPSNNHPSNNRGSGASAHFHGVKASRAHT
jgi:hypothetical protein